MHSLTRMAKFWNTDLHKTSKMALTNAVISCISSGIEQGSRFLYTLSFVQPHSSETQCAKGGYWVNVESFKRNQLVFKLFG